MKRILAVILLLGGLVLVALGVVISPADGAAAKYGAMLGGLILAGGGWALLRSTVEPEPLKRTKDLKGAGKLDFDRDGRSASAPASSDLDSPEPKPKASKRIDL